MKYFSKDHDVIGTYDPIIARYPYDVRKNFGSQCHPVEFLKKSGTNSIENYLKQDIDFLINEEGLIEAPESTERPYEFHLFNVEGFLNILELARKYEFGIICVGSNISYGDPIRKPITENHPQNPNSPYGATRVAQEKYALAYHHSYDIPVIVLRYSNLYGPYGLGVINSFIKDAIKINEINISGGFQTRTYTHILDAAEATELAMKSKKAIGQIYNVSGDETVNLFQISDKLKPYFNNLRIQYTKNWKGDITSSDYEISNRKIKKDLGFISKYNLNKGIKELIYWEFQYTI